MTGARRRSSGDPFSIALLAATFAMLAVDAWVVATNPYDAPVGTVVRETVFAAAWIVVGLVALRLRRVLLARRILALSLVLASTLVGSLWVHGDALGLRVLETLVALLVPLQPALVGHLFLSYPTGRVEERFGRRLVVAAYVVAGIQSLWWAFAHVSRNDCAECARPLRLMELPYSVDRLASQLFAVIWVGFSVVVVVLLARRYRRAGHRERRVLRLPYIATLVAVTFYGALSIVAGIQGQGSVWLISVEASIAVQVVAILGVPVCFLVGLLRERLAYRGIGELVIELAAGTGADLEQSLATALDDPQLSVSFPIADGYVDTQGRPVPPPEPDDHVTVTTVGEPAAPLAFIRHDRSLDEEPALLTAAGSATRLMLENARLQAEVRAQLREVRASRARIVTAANAARAQLERDLHDGAQQRMLAIGIALKLLREQPRDTTLLDAAETELSSALAELRELAAGIHPAVLTDSGLIAALEALATRLGPRVHLDAPQAIPRCAPAVEAAAYFSASEAITNALKHASPTTVRVSVIERGGRIVIRVRDGGPGGADANGSGLLGIRDRLASVDGTLTIDSRAGHGTELTLEVPCL